MPLRYEKAGTIITSNKAFSDWTELFHGSVIITAILDRLLHHSTVISIRGNSYRLMGKIAHETLEQDQNMGKWLSFHDRKWLNFKRPLTIGRYL